jgi:hypothetical protein
MIDSIRDNAGRCLLAALAVVGASIGWFALGHYYDVWNVLVRYVTHEIFVRQMFPGWNPIHWTPFTYALLTALVAIITLVMLATSRSLMGEHQKARRQRGHLVSLLLAIITLASSLYTLTGWWNNDKDEAVSYGAVTFVVEDPNNLPRALKPLLANGGKLTDKVQANGCLNTTGHDVPSCIKQGTYDFKWQQRTASLTGAQAVMNRISGDVPRTDIMDETLTYIVGAGWTAIRNGQNRQPLNGIVQWDGKSEKTTGCTFTDSDKINYAFGGKWSHNLDDLLAREYPNLLYSHEDISGYCDMVGTNRVPVIIVPVIEQQPHGRRTTMRPAGVLKITGTPSGQPQITHHSTVKSSDYPVPVYPLSLVRKQQDMSRWAAGRKYENSAGFGFKSSDAGTQAGNSDLYLLSDNKTGRTFWVTPLTPNSSNSQLVTAYAVVPADEVKRGALNTLSIYAPSDDSRRVNIKDMETRISAEIRDDKPGFFATDAKNGTGGTLTEFLPVDPTTWVVFLELNGRVQGEAIYSADPSVPPVISWYEDGNTGAERPPSGCFGKIVELGTGGKPTDLSKTELVNCVKQLTDALAAK